MTGEKGPVRNRLGLWGWIIPIAFVGAGVGVLLADLRSRNPYVPGAWLGNVSEFAVVKAILVFLACMAASLVSAFVLRPRDLFRVLIVSALIGFVVLVARGPAREPSGAGIPNLPEAMARYNVEADGYRKAVETQSRFGDQYSTSSAGRRITYWRWIQIGLDDAVGVVYDPADKYPAGEGDDRAFWEQTRGVPWRTKKVEPHWYLVWHS